jgi:DNA polymerase I
MKQDKNTLVILDAHALIHRAYHALPSFTSPQGEPMGAVYGVSAILIKLLRELAPTHIAAAFDREEKTFRHVAYEAYKATRDKTKDDLVPQFSKVKDLFDTFGIRCYEVAGFEADDIIGTLVKKFSKEKNIKIIIASGDMDTLQLVDGKRVTVYTPRKGIDDTVLYDESKVIERYGFGPEHVVDYKGLKGDPSDNIIGVKGIGEKTATLLIQQYGTIEEILKKIKKEKKHPVWLKERIKNLLLENEEEALFSKELATIRLDTPLEIKMGDLKYRGIPYEQVAKIFKEYHFPSLLARLNPSVDDGGEEKDSVKNIRALSKNHLQSFEIDINTSSVLAIYMKEEKLYIATDKDVLSVPATFADLLAKALIGKKDIICDDAKEIFHFLGYSFPIKHDLKIATWVCDSEQRTFDLSELEEAKSNNITSIMITYSGKLESKIKKEKLSNIYDNFELPLIKVLFDMEREGILLDLKELEVQDRDSKKEISALEKKIWKMAGVEFDINSPKQLSVILFETLELPTKGIKKTSTKSISTQMSELVKLRDIHPIIDHLIEYREISKLYSTYITALPKLVAADGRIHTTYNQGGSATGRLSSNNPNLQNIPIRSARGRKVRGAFIAEDKFSLVSFDYSQIEIRIAASLSRDKKMLQAFENGEDIHTRTASEIFHIDAKKVTQDMRRKAKTINFGILYGMGARALSANLKVSFAEADAYLEAHAEGFSALKEYREGIIETGAKKGFVETIFGRRRYLPNLRSSFDFVRKEAERMAFNAPLQGASADIIKRAMVQINSRFELGVNNNEIRMLLQVHDELLFEIKKGCEKKYVAEIKKIMEYVPEFKVPIVVDVKAGDDWNDMK